MRSPWCKPAVAAGSRGDGMSLPGEIRNEQCANPGVYPVSSVRIPQTEHPVSTARRGDPELRRMLRAYWNLARHPGPGEGVCARPSPAQGAVPRIQGLAAKEINVGPAATHASRRSPGEGFPLSASILCIATTISRRDHAAGRSKDVGRSGMDFNGRPKDRACERTVWERLPDPVHRSRLQKEPVRIPARVVADGRYDGPRML